MPVYATSDTGTMRRRAITSILMSEVKARKGSTLTELKNGPAVLSVPEAGRAAFGISDRRSYRLVQTGAFPVPVHGGEGLRKYVLASDLIAHLEGSGR